MKLLFPLMLLYSLFLFLRGHNHVGGGFVGGLVAAGAFALYAMANDVKDLCKILRVDTLTIICLGLFFALVAGLIPVFFNDSFLTGLWSSYELPPFVPFDAGTPILFELGVYLVVVGSVMTILISLMEE